MRLVDQILAQLDAFGGGAALAQRVQERARAAPDLEHARAPDDGAGGVEEAQVRLEIAELRWQVGGAHASRRRSSSTPPPIQTSASGARLRWPWRPATSPRFQAACGTSGDDRGPPGGVPCTIVCVLSERSPSRKAGHRSSRNGA